MSARRIPFTDHQIRAALLRIKTSEAFTVSGMRRLTQEEVANYYGEGRACPEAIWPWLKNEGLILFPSRLTDAGRKWLDDHPGVGIRAIRTKRPKEMAHLALLEVAKVIERGEHRNK